MNCLPRLLVSLLIATVTTLCPLSGPLLPMRGTALAQPPLPAGTELLASALQAERDGRDVEAEAGYRTLLGSLDPIVAAESNLALGCFLERRGRSAEAIAPLRVAATMLGASADGLAAQFLLGEAKADQKQADAPTAFQAYRGAGGPAGGYAALEEAWALQASGDDHAALDALLLPLRATSGNVRRAALKAASESLERLGDKAAAATDQQSLADTRPPATERAAALLEAGRLFHEARDDRNATDALRTIVRTYPGLRAAATALDRLDAIGAAVDPLQRAVVWFSLRRNDEAETAFASLLSSRPEAGMAAKATYYIAALADRADRNDAALSGYGSAFELDPTGDVAAEALWRRAQLLQALNRYGEAQSAYSDLVQRFPSGEHAADAAFDAGFVAYLDRRPEDAARFWTQPAQSTTAAEAARANLWLGKLAIARGDAIASLGFLARAQTAQPAGYFGLRAQALATSPSSPGLGGAPVAVLGAADWGQVEAWLRSWAGSEDATQFQSLQATQDWTEGLALDALGWQATPTTLLGDAIAAAQKQPWTLYRAARALQERGLTHLALRATDALLDLAPADLLSVPPPLLHLEYPVDYVALVNQAATQNRLDPLLVYALVRQESAFDPAIGSSAGAQGLAQLIPSTAQDVARSLGLSNFAATDLKRPAINLRLGASYLGQQVQAMAGDLSGALAAYNAGGGNATRWAKMANGDPDLFYQLIDFDETRLYIRLVSQNYAIYNQLYRGLPHPTLTPP